LYPNTNQTNFAMRLSTLLLAASSLILGILTLNTGCEDEKTKQQALLTGRWELVRGFRNAKETETLDGTYFRFEEQGKMQTNLPLGANENAVDFTLDKNEIIQSGPMPIKYTIQKLTDTELILVLELRGMQFEMHMKRTSKDGSALPGDTPTEAIQ
jgi:hypothetical protein